MFSGLIFGILVAWFFSIFDGDIVFVDGVYDIFHKRVSTATYYIFFGGLGVLSTLLHRFF